MKRIRSKLEGVDFGVQHKMPVSEQVNKYKTRLILKYTGPPLIRFYNTRLQDR